MADFINLSGVGQSFGDTDAQRAVCVNDRTHVFHTWSAQGHINPLPVARADGVRYWDYDGKEYLDFSSQLVYLNLGHLHVGLREAIHRQLDHLSVIQPAMANDARGELARLLVEHSLKSAKLVFFTNEGVDANEHAARFARHYTGRQKMLARDRSYHRATATAITLIGEPRRWANGTLDTGVVHFHGPYLYRSVFDPATPEEESEQVLAHLRSTMELEGLDAIAAILLETVTGTNSTLVLRPGLPLAGVRKLCNELFCIMMTQDEIMTGFGRIGDWFSCKVVGDGSESDMITFAKGVTSGYVPPGGVSLSEVIHNSFVDVKYHGGLACSGHPTGCAAGVSMFDIYKREEILERVRDLATRVIQPGLRALARRHPCVGQMCGKVCRAGEEPRHARAAGSLQRRRRTLEQRDWRACKADGLRLRLPTLTACSWSTPNHQLRRVDSRPFHYRPRAGCRRYFSHLNHAHNNT